MTEEYTAKDRKKDFDKIFREKIVPFFKTEGFERHTKTSKRLLKHLGDELSVFVFFEYKSFGKGFYDITLSYFDDDFGDVYEDEYLVMAQIKTPTISGVNSETLNTSTDLWLENIKESVIPFIQKHANHKAILDSNQFYMSKSREKERLDLLNRKSKRKDHA